MMGAQTANGGHRVHHPVKIDKNGVHGWGFVRSLMLCVRGIDGDIERVGHSGLLVTKYFESRLTFYAI